MANVQHTFFGTAAPTTIPTSIGAHYIDVANKIVYQSIGTSQISDWQNLSQGGVTAVNGRTGSVVLTKTDVGLGNVDNTSDVNKPVSTAQAAADAAIQAASIQRANHTGTQTASTISDFATAASTAAPVQSVAGKTGVVTLVKADVGLGNVDNISDVNKPVSTAQAAADAAVQAAAIQRTNHTGTQLASTISNFAASASAAAPVQSVAGKTGIVTLIKGDVGLGNVDNTTDLNKPVSTAQAAADAAVQAAAIQRANHTGTQVASTISDFSASTDTRITAQKGVANGLATLDATSKIPFALLPAIAITDTHVVASQAAMLALTAQTGDLAVRSDISQTFILTANDPTILSNWQILMISN